MNVVPAEHRARRQAEPAAHRLARYVLGLRSDELPAEVWDKVELCLLDFFSCCLMSRELPWSRQAAAWAASLGARPDCTVLGTDIRTAAGEAAFANGVAGHGLVREDMHVASASHIGVAVLPAVLAVAEREDASGAELATAIVAAYEVMARLGRAVLNEEFAARFRPTGTCGPVGAAAGATRLLGLGEESAVNAIGYAGNFGCGFNEWPWSGGGEIYVHAGMAARNGVLAADLARLGGQASATIIEGKAGLLSAFGAEPGAVDGLVGRLVGGLGDGFEILDVFHKPAPACNYVQTPAQAALRLVRAGGFAAAQIEAVRVRTFPEAMRYPGCDHAGPFETPVQAKMSLQYGVAAVLVRGSLDDESYRRLDDADILRIAAHTELVVDETFGAAYPGRQGTEVEVLLADGRGLRERLEDLVPLGADEVRARFRAEAGGTLSPGRAAEIEEAVATLRRLDSVRPLTALLSA